MGNDPHDGYAPTRCPRSNRAPQAVLLLSILVCVGSAYAQSPGAPLRYSVVAERSEARYRVREQLAGYVGA